MTKRDPAVALRDLRNVGKATLGDFALLGIRTLAELAARDPDELYRELERRTRSRQDPCVRDVFAATIHQARTGEALDWWHFTPERKIAPSATPRSSRSRPAAPPRTRARG
ncbi:MAG: Mitomycin resistance protein mcrB [Gemmatimonadetes bacterium]|nr:Mitomycin resistance protein mcrB [Gemmatimonadota bacterium]